MYRPKLTLFLWASLLLIAIIGELLPGDSTPMLALTATQLSDKFLHFGAYATIAFVPVFGLRLRAALICVITAEIVGISLEFSQLFVRDRSCDFYDLIANTIGILVGVAIAMIARSLLLGISDSVLNE